MQAAFACSCGEVRGFVSPAAPGLANRVTCYCDDCQAFAHYLGRADLLNAQGGSDIVQVPPATVAFTHGMDRIDGVRLSPKGLYRWRARCCNTPLGNTAKPNLPFVGFLASTFRQDGQNPDVLFGKPRGAIKGEYALGVPPAGSKGVGVTLLLTTIATILRWRLGGRDWPHPFFARGQGQGQAAPLYPVTVVSREERERLCPLCGPRAA